jgi:hypothetical protein
MPNNALEIAPNPIAVKLRTLMSDPRFHNLDPAEQQRVYKAISTGAPRSPAAPSTRSGGTGARRPLNAAQVAALNQLNATVAQLDTLQNRLKAIGPERWNRAGGRSRPIGGLETAGAPTRMYQAWGRRHGMSLAGSADDPEIDEMNRMMGRVTTAQAVSEAALLKSAGSRNYTFVTDVSGHLPNPEDDYTVIMDNLDLLRSDEGPYKSSIREIMGMGAQPSAAGAGILPGVPGSPRDPTGAPLPPPTAAAPMSSGTAGTGASGGFRTLTPVRTEGGTTIYRDAKGNEFVR